jgi:hypothetical protein
MQVCRYCSTPVDPAIAQHAAEVQERINRACNSASSIRNAAGAMWIFFLVRFLPCLGLAGVIGFLFAFFFVPVSIIFWQTRYGGIQTEDVDFKRAKLNKNIALLIWAPAAVLMAIWVALIFIAIISRR